ncbi:hypothetical protein [Candidatus Uabimicrobium sp. HlEnr_7]|uniref:hypothetical protein n=1 Tax=Candidatus Uabimicrobium helgolandensis TaxID=3095367 RepID=UPI0035571C1C
MKIKLIISLTIVCVSCGYSIRGTNTYIQKKPGKEEIIGQQKIELDPSGKGSKQEVTPIDKEVNDSIRGKKSSSNDDDYNIEEDNDDYNIEEDNDDYNIEEDNDDYLEEDNDDDMEDREDYNIEEDSDLAEYDLENS